MDTSAVTAYISGAVTDGIEGVGGALLILAGLALGFKWVKAMFF